jgi:molecular chaperone GrpE (heat shock protein)
MDQHSTGASEVLAFAPRQEPQHKHVVDEVGHRLVALLRDAANISAEKVERAMTMAHKASMELRAAEDRIAQLEAEVERLRDRATRAERWLETIKQEIEEKLIAPMAANRPELPVLH